jgi:hypothetical protein
MSRTLYIVLGIFAILCAISLVANIPEILATRPPGNPLVFFGGTAALVGVCIVIAIMCFFPRSHPITLRIIGAIGLVSTLYYLYDSFRAHNFARVGIALFFWLPGSIYLIFKGKMIDSPKKH